MVAFGSILLAISATLAAVDAASVPTCKSLRDSVFKIQDEVKEDIYFCNYYLSRNRLRTPFKGVPAKDVTASCKCILRENGLPIPKVFRPGPAYTHAPTPVKRVCNTAAAKVIRNSFKEPVNLCNYLYAV